MLESTSTSTSTLERTRDAGQDEDGVQDFGSWRVKERTHDAAQDAASEVGWQLRCCMVDTGYGIGPHACLCYSAYHNLYQYIIFIVPHGIGCMHSASRGAPGRQGPRESGTQSCSHLRIHKYLR